ncbi:hypothetical protein FOC1_g10000451 [Fusarium oxysporum f. sp. cubense race 1]|uniref:Uncharacterized protein n=1 Tax=Fusarium oxysporum f. sp. cubense (strain race 1) TaxID=1229664 RepID=N4TR95_FUSC1|nr:hypothetical protein FOC1_g10000451 [Fusarium oxysporum f. sp. cubense race 1]
MDINPQVVAELSRSGSQGRSERLGGRRCGIYGKGGYNVRTYKYVLKLSKEEFNE